MIVALAITVAPKKKRNIGDNMEGNWKDEMGLTQRKTKKMWELDGYCDKCRKPTRSMSQAERRRRTNHPIKYWKNFYKNLLNDDDVIRCALGYTNFIEAVASGDLIDYPESPYAAARQYRQSAGLLEAVYGYFGMGDVDSALEELRSSPFFDPNDEWWHHNG